jgi:hypothetical protein
MKLVIHGPIDSATASLADQLQNAIPADGARLVWRDGLTDPRVEDRRLFTHR